MLLLGPLARNGRLLHMSSQLVFLSARHDRTMVVGLRVSVFSKRLRMLARADWSAWGDETWVMRVPE